jgi:uncharacterized protein (DUF1800 family)
MKQRLLLPRWSAGMFLWILTWLGAASLPLAAEPATLWMLGREDGTPEEFSSENGQSNPLPGNPRGLDDDYYFTGNYPAPVGALLRSEPWADMERALTPGDPRVRIHFNLTPAQTNQTARFSLRFAMVWGGWWNPAINDSGDDFGQHTVQVLINGRALFTRTFERREQVNHAFDVSAFPMVTGDNVLEFRRTGGTANSWIQFDFIQLEADPVANLDADRDGLPAWWENEQGLSDTDATDAARDFDGDGRTYLQEFQARTNPRLPDTDGDGLHDGREVAAPTGTGTDPLRADTDGDGVSDGAEFADGRSDPLRADTDGDGSPDNHERQYGTDPRSASSRPTALRGAIGLQFTITERLESRLATNEIAGFMPQPNWNVPRAVFSWINPSNTQAIIRQPVAGRIANGAGEATATEVTWSSSGAWYTINEGSPLLRLYDVFLTAEPPEPARVEFRRIPYARYDLIAYIGGWGSGTEGRCELEGVASSLRTFNTLRTPAAGLIEIGPTNTPFRRGNYVRYRGLTSPTVTLRVAGDEETVGLCAVQIVDVSTDSDSDGMPDTWELAHRLDPAVNDASGDADGDGLGNRAEFQAGANPQLRDSDGDGLDDARENTLGTNPDMPDTDGDGLSDAAELALPLPTNPRLADTDGDGFSDGDEVRGEFTPVNAESSPGRLPRFTASPRQWTWDLPGVQLVWDHAATTARGDQWDWTRFFGVTTRVTNAPTGTEEWNREITMTLLFTKNRLTWHVVAGSTNNFTSSTSNPGDDLYIDEGTDPPRDLRRDLGFSGWGRHDVSDRLRFLFTATRPTGANNWSLRFQLFNQDTGRTVADRTITGWIAAPWINAGTAGWADMEERPGRITVQHMPGIRAFMLTNRIEGLLAGLDRDADNDGMTDAWETANGFDPASAADGPLDADSDGLSNVAEANRGTAPRVADTDGDGASDGLEAARGSDPTLASSLPPLFRFGLAGTPADLDGNGLSDAWERWAGTLGLRPADDTDGDGLSNLQESLAGTDPNDPNSFLSLDLSLTNAAAELRWAAIVGKLYDPLVSTNLTTWTAATNAAAQSLLNGWFTQRIPDTASPRLFFNLAVRDTDTDADGVSNWAESVLGTDSSRPNSARAAVTVAPPGGGTRTLSGDYAQFVETMNGLRASASPTNRPTRPEAARFLTQATFGPTGAEIDRLTAMGIPAWIDEQVALPPYLHAPYIRAALADHYGARLTNSYGSNDDDGFFFSGNITTPFARGALQGRDQLRQRVAFALSQILVISRRENAIADQVIGNTTYYDIFVRHGLGSYLDVLMEVSMHPCMGRYLSHVGNQKARPEVNQYPDENYAREIMQLFTIGLWELNPDGSRRLDGAGRPIPTYGNEEITQLARVFTGLWYPRRDWGEGGGSYDDFSEPMSLHPGRHDFGRKTLLNGFVIPARDATAANVRRDIEDAVNHLFQHPNTPVFVSRQLIQFFVTANPSPAFIRRVQDVFVNNGRGIRGDLGAVIRAVLLDPEARSPLVAARQPQHGKLREPVLRAMAIARALGVGRDAADLVWRPDGDFYDEAFQLPLLSPSVFNFYRPDHRPGGLLNEGGWVGPVFQITDTYSSISLPNELWEWVDDGITMWRTYDFPPDYRELEPLATDPEALLDRVNLLFCSGQMSIRTRDTIRSAVLSVPSSQTAARAKLAAGLAALSPDGAVQR